jgi:RNA polymerase sigma factor (sigma-70 family)
VAGGLDAFVASNRARLLAYTTRLVRDNRLDAEDVLQDALMRILKEFGDWPRGEETRLRYAQEAIQLTAADAARKQARRRRLAGEEVLVDFAAAEERRGSEDGHDSIASALSSAMAARADSAEDIDALVERSVVAASFKALDEQERTAMYLSLNGYKPREIAPRMGLDDAKVRQMLHQARAVVYDLVLHASGESVPKRDVERLVALREGRLSGREKRLARRHLENCAACQRLAELEGRVEGAAATAFVPPFLILAPLATSLMDRLHGLWDLIVSMLSWVKLQVLTILGRAPQPLGGDGPTAAAAGGGAAATATAAKIAAVVCLGASAAGGGAYCVHAIVGNEAPVKTTASRAVARAKGDRHERELAPIRRAPVAVIPVPTAKPKAKTVKRQSSSASSANVSRRQASRNAAKSDEFGFEPGHSASAPAPPPAPAPATRPAPAASGGSFESGSKSEF